MSALKKHSESLALALILLLAGFLSLYGIRDEGYGNEFYAACVKSMLQSWHNFFFVSFDPGGFVTVDKPPVGLWVQALSAKLLGFSGWSLILPQALASVASAAVLYRTVRRGFGAAAGLLSALALAVSPIFISVGKTNNLDSILVLVLLLAADALWSACETGKLRHLLLSMLLLGIGFNVKTLQAFLVLPAFLAAYFFAAKLRRAAKARHLLVSLVLLAAVSLSWCLIVDLTPADQRPYVDNSGNNSELSLALGYNGVQRLTGNMFGGGGQQPGAGGSAPSLPDSSEGFEGFAAGQRPDGSADEEDEGLPGGAPSGDRSEDADRQGTDAREGRGGFGGGNFGGGGGMNEGGSRGILRMFNEQMAGQTSWLLPFSAFSVLILLLRLRRKAGEPAERRRRLLSGLLLWGGWTLTMAVFFSVAGFFHRYYLATLSPGIAALFGIGCSELFRAYREPGRKWVLLPLSLAGTAAVQAVILARYSQDYVRITLIAVCALAAAASIGLVVLRLVRRNGSARLTKILTAVGLAALLAAPGIWSLTPILYGSQTSLPYAGPELERGGGSGMDGREGDVDYESLIDFLTDSNSGEKFLVAVPSSRYAETIILETGKPVMSVGGFMGSDKILTAESLAQMVKDGEVRYYLIAEGGMGGGSDDVTRWVEENGEEVDSSVWNGGAESSRMKLYDLTPSA